MSWRIIEIAEGDEIDSDLTDSELVGVSVSLASHAGKSANGDNVYLRSWQKLQSAVEIANSR